MQVNQIYPNDAYQILQNNQNSILIDVRTNFEWETVGIVDYLSFCNPALFISWQNYPDMQIDPDFLVKLESSLNEKLSSIKNYKNSADLIFLCRTGIRSNAAAELCLKNGYSNLFNIINGFEGDSNQQGQRSLINGWKAQNLPIRTYE